jgi:hypothetical protein
LRHIFDTGFSIVTAKVEAIGGTPSMGNRRDAAIRCNSMAHHRTGVSLGAVCPEAGSEAAKQPQK